MVYQLVGGGKGLPVGYRVGLITSWLCIRKDLIPSRLYREGIIAKIVFIIEVTILFKDFLSLLSTTLKGDWRFLGTVNLLCGYFKVNLLPQNTPP